MAGRKPKSQAPPTAFVEVPLQARAVYQFLLPDLSPEQTGDWLLVRWYRRRKGRQILGDFQSLRTGGLRTVMISRQSAPIETPAGTIEKRIPVQVAAAGEPHRGRAVLAGLAGS